MNSDFTIGFCAAMVECPDMREAIINPTANIKRPLLAPVRPVIFESFIVVL
jgi:hypothetical protein